MNIQEDYVSFETAKLLKEKGFNESCYTYYDYIDDSINRFDEGYHFKNKSYPWGVPYDFSKAKKYVVAPTLQMAMKWLREKHSTFISITYENDGVFTANLKVPLEEIDCMIDNKHNCWFTYEQAVEAAIKYCLENLI